MHPQVPDNLRALLREVLGRRCERMLPWFEGGCETRLERAECELIQGALSDELCETGIDEVGEVNERGVLLDRLIGIFGV